MTEIVIPRCRRTEALEAMAIRRFPAAHRSDGASDIVRGEKPSGLPGVCASATRSACRVQLSGGTHAESNLAVLTNFTGAVLALALRTHAR